VAAAARSAPQPARKSRASSRIHAQNARTAGRVPARFVCRRRLEIGAPADFVAFRQDPTADVAALDTLEAVAIRGRLYLRADLDAALRRYLDWYANPLLDWIAVTKARTVLADAVRSAH
jgi:hypothetical protein